MESLQCARKALPIYNLLRYPLTNNMRQGAFGSGTMWAWINDAGGWMSGTLGLVADHPDWALAAAFLAAIIEAVAVVGTIVPGTVIVMGVAGAAAAAGQPVIPILLVAILGAVIGDFVSYWVGYRFRFRVRQWWPLATRPYLMASADRFFERYGSYSVALCRFIPVLRSLVPLVAGISGMSRRRFLIANVASALVWAPAHVCPAQLAGLSIERLRAGDWQSAAYLAAGLVVSGAAIWMLHRRLTTRVIAARR
jgi:membrane protein DedA with SNARE-associated domain